MSCEVSQSWCVLMMFSSVSSRRRQISIIKIIVTEWIGLKFSEQTLVMFLCLCLVLLCFITCFSCSVNTEMSLLSSPVLFVQFSWMFYAVSLFKELLLILALTNYKKRRLSEKKRAGLFCRSRDGDDVTQLRGYNHVEPKVKVNLNELLDSW